MARKQQKIKTISYVRVGGQLVNTDDLDPERKRQLADWLKLTYLNNLFRGKAVFWVEEGKSGEQPPGSWPGHRKPRVGP